MSIQQNVLADMTIYNKDRVIKENVHKNHDQEINSSYF